MKKVLLKKTHFDHLAL